MPAAELTAAAIHLTTRCQAEKQEKMYPTAGKRQRMDEGGTGSFRNRNVRRDNPGEPRPGTSEETTAGTSAGTGAAAETSAGILTEYTVQKGDSLSRISEKYYGTMSRVKDICAMNGITSEDVIYAGQKILLPK